MRQFIIFSCIIIGCNSAVKKRTLDDMFLETNIVTNILDEKPQHYLKVFIIQDGKNVSVQYVDEREAIEARSDIYYVEIPKPETFDVWRFVLHVYYYEDMDEHVQILAWLEMNRNHYRWWNRDTYYHQNLLTHTENRFRKDLVVQDTFYNNYPIDCKFLGSKELEFYDIWLYGRQQERIPVTPLRKFSRLRTAFKLQKFIDKYNLEVLNGATVTNYCRMDNVDLLKIILLPFVITLALIGLYGAIALVTHEVERGRKIRRAEKRAAKEQEEREKRERLEQLQALEED